MEIKEYTPESSKPFIVRPDSISPQREMKDVHVSKLLHKLGAPEEIMMGAWAKTKENGVVELAYPSGDVYLSTAIIIHETGHLRQDEHLIELPDVQAQIQKEQDAQERGWRRFQIYAPIFLEELNQKFNDAISDGRVKSFESFTQLYEFINEVVNIKINQALLAFDSPEEQLKELKNQRLQDDFNKLKEAIVGMKVNEDRMNEILLTVLQSIANE